MTKNMVLKISVAEWEPIVPTIEEQAKSLYNQTY